jgi:hypothetical protein
MRVSAQLSTLPYLSAVLSRAAEVLESGVTPACLKAPHFVRVFLKSPKQLLKPCVTDAKLPSPITTRGLFAAGCEPLEHISANHARFVATGVTSQLAIHDWKEH